jgi:vancomycin resistance protein YoaR
MAQLSTHEPTDAGLPQLSLLGKPLKLDSKAPARAVKRLRARVGGLFSLTVPHGDTQKVSYGDLGVEIDKARLAQLLRDSVDQTSPLSRWRRRNDIAAATPLELPAPLRVNVERAVPLLLALKDEFDRPSVDARLDLEHRRVTESVEGLLLDVDTSVLAIDRALSEGKTEAALVFETVMPRRRTEQLSDVRFDHVIASFETPYDRSMKSAARTFNLRLAASKLDGTVLFPGEVFDFNQTVGARDEANGYKVAPVIAQGELVDGIGGGTCQVSGTLHGAAFFAGLDMVERYPHTRPSSYIKLGLDATVVYPTINFRFKNPFDFPVVLHETVKDGAVRAEILGPPTDRTVTLIRRILAATPYDEVERPDPRLPKGKRVLGQRGVPGFKVRMYRIVREGPHAEREVWNALYPPTTQIIRVGTGTESSKAVHDDPHGEYTADELLIITLNRPDGADADAPEQTERREPGRYGTPGWTAEAGMPLFERNQSPR